MVQIKPLICGAFDLDCEGTQTILQVKEKIQAKRNDFLVPEIKLIYQGKILQDDLTLGELPWHGPKTLHLVVSQSANGPKKAKQKIASVASSQKPEQTNQEEGLTALSGLYKRDDIAKLPLQSCVFSAEIEQGFADLLMVQTYKNESESNIETLFMMPASTEFALNKVVLILTFEDGTIEQLETRICEREQAK